jgi:hypothetical protein
MSLKNLMNPMPGDMPLNKKIAPPIRLIDVAKKRPKAVLSVAFF